MTGRSSKVSMLGLVMAEFLGCSIIKSCILRVCESALAANDFCEKGRDRKMDYFGAMTAFVRAVELGSFSKGAAEGGLKVSTVSRHVSGLETDLGAALLNRSTRRLNLTEAGRVLYEREGPILAEG